MKQLTCEMCGSTDLVKQDGVFVCQSCGCKYSVEEAKKMMVEITGKVKIDSSEKLANMIVNAKRAYEDQKFSDAERLFGDILNEEPDNPTAILYQGLSLGWQGNTVRYYMDKTGSAAERALEIAHAQMGDGNEFESFVMDAISNVKKIVEALIALCQKNISNAISQYSHELDVMKANMSPYSDFSYLQRRANEAEQRCMNEMDKQKKIIDNTLLIELSVNEKALKELSNVEKYKPEVYTKIKKNFSELIAYGNSLKSVGKGGVYFITKANSLTNVADDYLSKQKKLSIEKYWVEHPEEKAELDLKFKQSTEEKTKIENQITILNKRIKELQQEEKQLSQEEIMLNGYKDSITKLSQEKKDLGLFKRKEKKALEEQIISLQEKCEQLEPIAKNNFDARSNDINSKIKEVQDQLSSLKKEQTNVENRMISINRKLNLL